MLRDTRFIIVRAKYPYVQFAVAAHVISIERFVIGGTNGRERDRSQVSDGKVEWVLRARLLLSCVLCALSGVPCPPFYRPRRSRDYIWEKEKKTRGREGPSKVPGLPFPLSLPY